MEHILQFAINIDDETIKSRIEKSATDKMVDEMNDFDDYYEDHCYECTGYGDDYYVDDDGELVCACDECCFNEYRGDGDE